MLITKKLSRPLALCAVNLTVFMSVPAVYAGEVELRPNNASWMASIASEIENKSLREIVLPGSHDSGSRDWQGRCCGAAQVETQNLTIKQQLYYGIRYFDFRVTYNSGDQAWIFSHNGWDMEDQVFPALDDIKAFLSANPKEVVVVDFQNFPEWSDSDDQANLASLRTKLMNTLGSYMLPPAAEGLTQGIHTPLHTLWSENKRLVVLMSDDAYYKTLPDPETKLFSDQQRKKLWRRNLIESPWADAEDEEDAIRFLDDRVLAMDTFHSKFYVTQAVSTASYSLDSLKDGANDTNPVILSILEGNKVPLINNIWRGLPFNIIIADYVDTIDFTPVIKSMNMDSIENGAGQLDDGVYLYQHSNYGGYFTRLNESTPTLSKRFIVDQNGYDDHTSFNDQVSSIRIVGDYKVVLYEHNNYSGSSATYSGNSAYVGNNFNDKASSAKVYKVTK